MNWRKRGKKDINELGECFIGLCGWNQTAWAEPARATLAILKLADQPNGVMPAFKTPTTNHRTRKNQ